MLQNLDFRGHVVELFGDVAADFPKLTAAGTMPLALREIMDDLYPGKVGGDGLAAGRILGRFALAQRRRLEVDFGADDGLQLDECFGFVKELGLAGGDLQLLAACTEAIRVEHPKRFFQ